MSYNLNRRQKDLLTAIVQAAESAKDTEFYYVATHDAGERVFFNGSNLPEIPAKLADLEALQAEGMIAKGEGAEWSLRHVGEQAVGAHFNPPPAKASPPSMVFRGAVGSVQTGEHARATVHQNLSAVADEALTRLDKVQEHVAQLAQQDVQLGTYLAEVIQALEEMKRRPEEGKPKLAALLEKGTPYVEMAAAIAGLAAALHGGK